MATVSLLLPARAADIVVAAISLAVVYFIALGIYRLTLHPYAKYPGPFLAKLTSLYAVYHAYTGNIHLDVERCHKKYGKFVRYRPDALLVNSPTGFHDIYGNLKRVMKAPSYDVHGPGNLIGIQDKKDYAIKKKIFQQGFSDVALRKHEPKVIHEINTFCEKLVERESSQEQDGDWTMPKDMNEWSNYLTTDVISMVVFTTSWNLLTSSKNRGVRETMSAIVRLIGILHQSALLRSHGLVSFIFLPNLTWSVTSLRNYTKAVIQASLEMREKDPSVSDYFGQFTSAKDPETGQPALSRTDVRLNSSNFIIAGSDTTSSSMAATFYYLSRHPEAYAKVAAEVRSTFSSPDDIRQGPALNSCIYLRAAINEAMRMCPVAPQPLWRLTEPGGCVVDGQHIPGGLVVGAGIYSLHRNAIAFPEPYKYDIERWIVHTSNEKGEDEEKEKARIKEMTRSFAPFSVGPRQCIAKNFALMELMLAIANVFWRLDFAKPSGGAGKVGHDAKCPGTNKEGQREGELRFRSYFTSQLEGPMIQFKKREL